MIGLTIDAVDDEVDLYGKHASDLQSDIKIDGTNISGTLKKVDDYSSAFPDNEKSGYFLALSFDAEDGATVEVRLNGGTNPNSVDVTEDGFCVFRIADKDKEILDVDIIKGKTKIIRMYSLKGLVLA